MANFYIDPIDEEERPYSGMKFYISDEDKVIIRDMIEKLNDALATATFKDAAEKLISSFERNNLLLSRLTEVIEAMPYSRTESIISGLEELKNRLDAMGSSDNDEIKARLGELNSLMQENNIIIEKSLEAFSQKSKETLSGVEGLKNEISLRGDETGLAELKELMSVKDNRMLSNVSEIRSMLQENDEMLERSMEKIAQKENDAISSVAETNALIQESNEILERNLEVLSKKESAILSSFEEIKDALQKKDDQIQMPLNELKELLAENNDRITSNINDVASLLQDNNNIIEKNLEILSKKDSVAITSITELKEAIYGLKDTLTEIMDKNAPEINLEGINTILQENYSRILPEIAVYKKDIYDMISQKDSEDITRFESISEAMNKIHSEINSLKSGTYTTANDSIELIKDELSRFSNDIKKLKTEPLADLKEEMKVIESIKSELSKLSSEIKKTKPLQSADLKEEMKVIESIKSDVFSIFNEIKTLKEAIVGTSAKPGKVGIKGLKRATEEIKELKASLAEMNSTVNAINTLNSYLYSAYDINNLLLALQTSSSKMPDWAERKQKQMMLIIRSTLDELVDLSIIKSLNESEKNIAQLTADVPADDELVKNRLDALIKADKVTILKKGDKISYGLTG